MNDDEYQQFLDRIEESTPVGLGGFGPKTVQSLRAEFNAAQFETACRRAYEESDTDTLEQVSGIGRGYALKLGREAGRQFGWSGADAESVEVTNAN